MLPVGCSADNIPAREACARKGLAAMELGSLVSYGGRTYYLRGLDPMSVADRRADLEDAETGERLQAPLSAVEPSGPLPAA